MQTVYAPLDFSDATDSVLAAAGELARAGSARVVAAHAVQPPLVWDQYASVADDLTRQEIRKAEDRLEQIVKGMHAAGIQAESHLLYGSPGASIVEDARACAADYIVLGSRGHGALRHLLLGSTTTHILKYASCPVLVIPVGGSFHAIETRERSRAGAG